MTPGGYNEDIRSPFANKNNLPHKLDLKQELGKNSLVQPIDTALSHDAMVLIDAQSKNICPADCGEDCTLEHIEEALIWRPHPSADTYD